MRRLAAAAITIGVTLLAAACATTPSPSPSGPAPTAPMGLDPDHVLVTIDDVSGWPGFAGVEDPRLVTLTADGTLVTRVPANGWLPITHTRLDRAALDRAWATVQASGTATDASFDLPGLFDASTTVIGVDDGTRSTELSIYGLGIEAGDEPFGPEEDGLRRAASSLISELRLLAGPEPWSPPALLLWIATADEEGHPQTVPWSLPVDLATAGAGVDNPVYDRCVRLEGEVAGEVGGFMRSLPVDTQVEQDDVRYALAVRPIYPDELGEVDCP